MNKNFVVVPGAIWKVLDHEDIQPWFGEITDERLWCDWRWEE